MHCLCGCGQLAPVAKSNLANKGHVKGQPLPFIAGHANRYYASQRPWEDLFWANVLRMRNGCWYWTGSQTNGYGLFHVKRIDFTLHRVAHKVAYELVIGEVPQGTTLDHLCRHTLCVHPLHLEPVPHSVNLLRGNTVNAANAAKTHCKHGHEFTQENTYRRPDSGARMCKECGREARRKFTKSR